MLVRTFRIRATLKSSGMIGLLLILMILLWTIALGNIAYASSIKFDLIGGHYTSGIDFYPGVYDIEVISGAGNVFSSNPSYLGGINALIGTADKNGTTKQYEQQYSNVDLPKGTILSVSGVSIRILSRKMYSSQLEERYNFATRVYTFKSGHYEAGLDFQSGIYDIIAITGSGNVYTSVSLQEEGINAIMGTANKKSTSFFYEEKYRNINLRTGVILSISGLTVELIPSR